MQFRPEIRWGRTGRINRHGPQLLDQRFFWLNPLAQFFALGTTRQLVVQPDGSEDLLLTYTSGGDTLGDSYLWQVNPDGRPQAWRMWVSIIPLGGVKATWQQWMQLETGAWISPSHRLFFSTWN